jgi:dienelactone hydrolase
VIGAAHDRYCELQATITYPQFQGGVPPYDTDGLIHFGPDGLPVKTRDEAAPITLSLPKTAMPQGGFPLIVYFHGTGGVSDAIADRGTWHYESDPSKCPVVPATPALDTWNGKTGCNTKGQGPAYVVAEHGIAMAASALPVNPQRFPAGANKDLPEYFNINNVASLRDIFRQGVMEQRMFIDALRRMRVDPSAVAACTGLSLPAGETAYRFADAPLLAQGQSMGAMYANMVSATEPRIQATVATGAGGYWSWFILETSFIDKLPAKLGLLLGLHDAYTFLHPTMGLAQTALEPADPFVYMPRLGRDPLPSHPARAVYQPVGMGDSYFPTSVQDAAAVAYGHQQAGDLVWPTMQDALSMAGLGGVLPYDVSQNETSLAGAKSTGVVVQYQGDGIYDPHAIYSQLDAVKYQYGCFFKSFVTTGHATVPKVAPLGTPCPM